jgi:hypothetical protein
MSQMGQVGQMGQATVVPVGEVTPGNRYSFVYEHEPALSNKRRRVPRRNQKLKIPG